jgi:hypothetical protein
VGDGAGKCEVLLAYSPFRRNLKKCKKTPCRTARAVKADGFNPIEIGLRYCLDLNMIPRIRPEGMLFGKPDSTSPDHALGCPFRRPDPGHNETVY